MFTQLSGVNFSFWFWKKLIRRTCKQNNICTGKNEATPPEGENGHNSLTIEYSTNFNSLYLQYHDESRVLLQNYSNISQLTNGWVEEHGQRHSKLFKLALVTFPNLPFKSNKKQ